MALRTDDAQAPELDIVIAIRSLDTRDGDVYEVAVVDEDGTELLLRRYEAMLRPGAAERCA